MAYYLLITSDTEDIDGNVVSAYDVIGHRAKRGVWPLYKGTPNRSQIQSGDECVLYAAGRHEFAQHFLYRVTIRSVETASNRDAVDLDNILSSAPDKIINLFGVREFTPPKAIRQIMTNLHFIPKNTAAWGCVMQGGCKKIGKEDFSLICR